MSTPGNVLVRLRRLYEPAVSTQFDYAASSKPSFCNGHIVVTGSMRIDREFIEDVGEDWFEVVDAFITNIARRRRWKVTSLEPGEVQTDGCAFVHIELSSASPILDILESMD